MTKLVSRADLVAQYNVLAEAAGKHTVKDFKSKAVAEQRIAALKKEQPGAAQQRVAEAQVPLNKEAPAGTTDAPEANTLTSAQERDLLASQYFNEGILAVADSFDDAPVAVVLHNNDNTAQWHVTEILKDAAGIDEERATEIMYEAHEGGHSTVLQLPKPQAVELFKKLHDKIVELSKSGEARCVYVKELRFTLEVVGNPATSGVTQ